MSSFRQANDERIQENESIRRRAISVVYDFSTSKEDCADLVLLLGLEKPAAEWYDTDFRAHLPKGAGPH